MSLEELYARLTMENEGDEGVIIGNKVNDQGKESFMLVGRFLTEKNINFNAMQKVLADIWRLKKGVEIHDIGEMRYSFIFYHHLDVQKVLEGGPWSFEQGMLVYRQVSENEDPQEVPLNETELWVQIYDMPRGCVSENVLQSVGNYIGVFVKSDPTNFNGLWKTYVRIRVKINVLQPLKRGMKIKREGGNWSWLNFKYERLSSFCFIYGILGHSERDCNVVYENSGVEIERAYGAWLRAPGRNIKNNTGSRWLRNEDNESKWSSEGGRIRTPVAGDGDARDEAKFKGYQQGASKN